MVAGGVRDKSPLDDSETHFLRCPMGTPDAVAALAGHPGPPPCLSFLVSASILPFFTIFNAAVFRPLAAPDPSRVVRIYEDSANTPRRKMFSFREYVDYRNGSTTFTDLTAYADTDLAPPRARCHWKCHSVER